MPQPKTSDAQRRAIEKYSQSDKGKATRSKAMRKYFDTKKGKAARSKAVNKYFKTEKGKKYRATVKITALSMYGGVCACCGEGRPEFLCIDHINGGGNKHRKEVGGGSYFYWWLKKNNYPPGFRVLCHNCNMSFGSYGYCPHNEISLRFGVNQELKQLEMSLRKDSP